MYFNGTKCSFVVFCCALSLSLSAKNVKTAPETQGLHKPLCFVENKGQVVDDNNNIRTDVQYKLSAPGVGMYVGNGQLKYQFTKIQGDAGTNLQFTTYNMSVTLLGANKNAQPEASDKQVYTENYYLGGKKGFAAHSYDRITYKNVYHNIDWVLYIKNDKVEYDFVVRPGGNVNDIRIKYDGATALSINKDGGISATTPMGNVEEKAPYAYETATGNTVASKFVLHDNVVSFATDNYKGSLTIDPALLWSTYIGGTAVDVATSVQVNTTGTFICGYSATGGRTLTSTVGTPHQATNAGGAYDAFIAKYDATGNIIWSTYYGGTGNDQGMSIALDNPGNSVYMTGFTTSTSGIVAGSSPFRSFKNPLNDAFLVKLNSNTGTETWETYYGGEGDDYGNAVACDPSGNVYISGQTNSATGIANGVTTAYNGGNDAFVAKFSSTGTIQWSRYFGGGADDESDAMVCDNTNSVIITGKTASVAGIATTGAYRTSPSGFNDAFVAKFNTLGTQLWGTYFGGPGEEQGNGIAVNAANDFVIVGNTTSASGVASAHANQSFYAGGPQDAFVAYFNNGGTLKWSTYYGGEQPDYGQGVCFDAYNNVVITGATFSSAGIFYTNGEPQATLSGSYDCYLAKFTPLGQIIWGTYFGGPTYDFANGVACNTTNNQLTIAGISTGNFTYGSAFTGGISTLTTNQPSNPNPGVYDGFVTTFKRDTFLLIDQPFVDSLVCAGGTLSVPFTVYSTGVSYLPGNVFYVQMSDTHGSFVNPDTIGSGTVSPIVCTVPNTPGTGYRIRIIAFSPQYTSPDDYYNITITGPSLPAPSIGSNSPVCVGNTLYLYSSAPYALSGYNWSGPGGYFASIADPVRLSVTHADSGTYTLITAHNGCPADTVTTHVSINDFVAAPTPVDSASVTCDGSNMYLFANSGVPGASYMWTGPGGFTSTMQNPVIPAATFSNTGTYTVRDTVGGCQSLPSSITVNVLPLMPTSSSITADGAYINGAPGDTICTGTLVTFRANTVNGGFSPQYQWMSSGSPIVGAVAQVYSSPTLLDGQQIYCIVTSSLSCPLPATTTSNTITMNVINNAPIVYIANLHPGRVAPGTVDTFTSEVYNGGVGPTYQWQVNHADVPGATNSTFVTTIISSNDTISLNVASTMMCAVPNTATSNMLIIETNVGVSSLAAPLNNVALYPNPNTGTFTIKGNVAGINNATVSLAILNAIGQSVYSGTATVQNNELNKTISLQGLADGIYMLRLNEGDQSKTFSFSIQR